MTVVEAYREVGMPRSSFYYIVEKNPQAIADIQAFKEISNREQLAMILHHKTEMLEIVIRDGISEKTKPRIRLSIYIKLYELIDELIERLQREDETDRQDSDSFLTGPKLIKVESRFAPR